MLEEHRRAATKAKVAPLRPDDALIFEHGGPPLRYGSVRSTLLRALKRAGLPGIRPHDLRHTAGSLLLDAGVPLATVSAFLGHSSPATTAAVYAHVVRRAGTVVDALQAHQKAHRNRKDQK